jgi:hypothetical protein
MITMSPGLRVGSEELLDIGFEGLRVDRAVENQRRHDAVEPQPSHQRRRLPVAVGNGGAQPLAASGAAVATGHVGRGPSLIDKDQLLGVESRLAFHPILAALQDVRPFPLGSVRRLFLSVIPRRAKKRQIVETLKRWPVSARPA